jgi:hypothetical protein
MGKLLRYKGLARFMLLHLWMAILLCMESTSSRKIVRRRFCGRFLIVKDHRTSSRISIEQTRSRSRSSSCDVDVTPKSKNVSKQLPLPPLVGVHVVGSPSSACHFDDSRPSRSASLGSLATVPGTQQTAPPSQATPQADYDLDEVPHGAAGPILGALITCPFALDTGCIYTDKISRGRSVLAPISTSITWTGCLPLVELASSLSIAS